jgi:extracellular factor (EF) 3-hydroxypalmitic acid methyl ester biosynthesis protein
MMDTLAPYPVTFLRPQTSSPTLDSLWLTDKIYTYLHRLDQRGKMAVKLLTTSSSAGRDLSAQIATAAAEFEQHSSKLTEFLDTAYAQLADLDRALTQEERRSCVAYHRALVQPFFLQTRFVRRSVDKPLGYPGDYGLVEILFDNKSDGDSPLSRLLSSYALNCGPARAHRSRMSWVHGYLHDRTQRTPERQLHVLSFACGPERILREFVAIGGTCAITLCDFDCRALSYCQREFKKLARRNGIPVPIHTVELSAHNLIKDPASSAPLRAAARKGGYDVILVLGLLDYLPDNAVTKFLDALVTLLQPDGDILLSNVHTLNPWRAFMEYVGDWVVIHREEREFEALAIGKPPRLRMVEAKTDETGTNLFFVGRRDMSPHDATNHAAGTCSSVLSGAIN